MKKVVQMGQLTFTPRISSFMSKESWYFYAIHYCLSDPRYVPRFRKAHFKYTMLRGFSKHLVLLPFLFAI